MVQDSIKVRFAQAIDAMRSGRFDEANRALEADGGALLKTPAGQNIRGDIFLKQQRHQDALKAFDAAVKLAPSAPEGYSNRGVALLALGRLEEALAAQDRALRQRSDYATAHYNRGNALKSLGRTADAIAAYGSRGSGRMHVPGDKGGPGADPGLRAAIGERALLMDVPQGLYGVDLGVETTPQLRAEALAAEAYGASRSWFLTNGATQGNHALALALAPPGRTVVVQRNSHASVVDGLVLSGGHPAFVAPAYDDAIGIAHTVEPAALEAAPAGIRSAGYSAERDEAVPGVACVAAPIRSFDDVVAAVSVCGPRDDVRVKELRPLVMWTAAEISRSLMTGASPLALAGPVREAARVREAAQP